MSSRESTLLVFLIGVACFCLKATAAPPVGPSVTVQENGTNKTINTRIINFTDCTVTAVGGTRANVACGGGGGGTVTSVALSMPSIFSVAGSPVTTSGTLAVTLATESANTVFAGPTSGGAATPTFRALVTADLPSGIAFLASAQTFTAAQTISASSSVVPLTIDGNNRNNVTGIDMTDLGSGTSGVNYAWTGDGGTARVFQSIGGSFVEIGVTNRHIHYISTGGAFDSSTSAHIFEMSGQDNTDTTVRIKGQASQTGALLELQNSSATVVSTISVAGKVTGTRLASVGTALVAGDFALSAGWGSTASIAVTRGSDGAAVFVVTSNGTGQGANPTITLTFKDGTWTSVPVCDTDIEESTDSAALGEIVVNVPTATTNVITYRATPNAGITYTFSMMCVGT